MVRIKIFVFLCGRSHPGMCTCSLMWKGFDLSVHWVDIGVSSNFIHMVWQVVSGCIGPVAFRNVFFYKLETAATVNPLLFLKILKTFWWRSSYKKCIHALIFFAPSDKTKRYCSGKVNDYLGPSPAVSFVGEGPNGPVYFRGFPEA